MQLKQNLLEIYKALANAFQKERVPERVPQNEERSRNAFLVFNKGTQQERNHKNQEERTRSYSEKGTEQERVPDSLKRNAEGTRS